MRQRASRVGDFLETEECLLVGDVGYFAGIEEGGASVVVGVGVGVDEVRDGDRGGVADCVEEVVAEGGRTVDDDYTLVGDEEYGLVGAVEDSVGAFAEGLDVVASRGDYGADSCSGNRSIYGGVVGAGEVAMVGEGGGEKHRYREEGWETHVFAL